MKSHKMPYIIYSDIESLIKNNPEKSSITKEDCMKKFCESLRECTKKYNWFWKEKLLSLTKKNWNHI